MKTFILGGLLLALVGCTASDSRHRSIVPTEPLASKPGGDPCQSVNTWALDRIDQSAKHLDGKYCYWPSAGGGIPIYIVDSGIRCTHVDFDGRCAVGMDFVGDGLGTDDRFGHGTQMAGIATGTTYGVGKLSIPVPVRVIDSTGHTTDATVLAGLNWILNNHTPPGIINLSLDGDSTNAVGDSTTVAALINAGFAVVVAAGNGPYDACSRIAGKFPTAIRVGATSPGDSDNGTSNYGPCVDIFAPGAAVVSDWYTSDVATFSAIGGTSQAAAHVSGAAALYIAEHPTATPASVKAYLIGTATNGVLSGLPPNTVNRLLRTHNGLP
jgi:subtilisin family serine protease